MKVSIVIPNWNGEEKLKRNLPKVLEVKGVDEVIVVDDGSTDGSVKLLVEQFLPKIRLVHRANNGGFSSSVNSGVRAASGDFVFLLNSDAVPETDCIEKLTPHFKDPKIFSVGANVGGSWNWARWENGWFWHNQYGDKAETEAHPTMWASGGNSLFRKDLWDEFGGLDELMNPFYIEDTDIGYRAWKRGYQNWFEPKSRVEHYKEVGVIEGNFSRRKINLTAQRNELLFIWKNIHQSNLFFQHILRLLSRLILTPGYWRVFLAALTKLPSIVHKRQIEKKYAKVSDTEILSKYQLKQV